MVEQNFMNSPWEDLVDIADTICQAQTQPIRTDMNYEIRWANTRDFNPGVGLAAQVRTIGDDIVRQKEYAYKLVLSDRQYGEEVLAFHKKMIPELQPLNSYAEHFRNVFANVLESIDPDEIQKYFYMKTAQDTGTFHTIDYASSEVRRHLVDFPGL